MWWSEPPSGQPHISVVMCGHVLGVSYGLVVWGDCWCVAEIVGDRGEGAVHREVALVQKRGLGPSGR